MHPAQKTFCKFVKNKHPKLFKKKFVLDVGSLDINGNNRYLFSRCNYFGIDIVPAAYELNNVDLQISCVDYLYDGTMRDFDVIISTEMLEHSKSWRSDVGLMHRALISGGLLLITAAGDGREEHGTTKRHPGDSPATNDYYQNISLRELSIALPADKFKEYHLEYNAEAKDIYFYGIKK